MSDSITEKKDSSIIEDTKKPFNPQEVQKSAVVTEEKKDVKEVSPTNLTLDDDDDDDEFFGDFFDN